MKKYYISFITGSVIFLSTINCKQQDFNRKFTHTQSIHTSMDPLPGNSKRKEAKEYTSKGNDYRLNKDYEKALNAFKQALEKDSTYADAYYGQGRVYYDMKKYLEGKASYKKALEYNFENIISDIAHRASTRFCKANIEKDQDKKQDYIKEGIDCLLLIKEHKAQLEKINFDKEELIYIKSVIADENNIRFLKETDALGQLNLPNVEAKKALQKYLAKAVEKFSTKFEHKKTLKENNLNIDTNLVDEKENKLEESLLNLSKFYPQIEEAVEKIPDPNTKKILQIMIARDKKQTSYIRKIKKENSEKFDHIENEIDEIRPPERIQKFETVVDKYDELLKKISIEKKEKLKSYYDGFTSTLGTAFTTAEAIQSGSLQLDVGDIKIDILCSIISLIPIGGEQISQAIGMTYEFIAAKSLERKAKILKNFGVNQKDYLEETTHIARELVLDETKREEILENPNAKVELTPFGAIKKYLAAKFKLEIPKKKAPMQYLLGEIDAQILLGEIQRIKPESNEGWENLKQCLLTKNDTQAMNYPLDLLKIIQDNPNYEIYAQTFIEKMEKTLIASENIIEKRVLSQEAKNISLLTYQEIKYPNKINTDHVLQRAKFFSNFYKKNQLKNHIPILLMHMLNENNERAKQVKEKAKGTGTRNFLKKVGKYNKEKCIGSYIKENAKPETEKAYRIALLDSYLYIHRILEKKITVDDPQQFINFVDEHNKEKKLFNYLK